MIDNLANISICTLLIIASVRFVSNVDWNIQEVKPKCFHLMDPDRAILVAITYISVFADCIEIPASVEVFPNSLGRVACLIWICKLVCQLQSPSGIYSVLPNQISPYVGLLFSLRHREVLSQHHWLVSPKDTTDLMWPCVSRWSLGCQFSRCYVGGGLSKKAEKPVVLLLIFLLVRFLVAAEEGGIGRPHLLGGQLKNNFSFYSQRLKTKVLWVTLKSP